MPLCGSAQLARYRLYDGQRAPWINVLCKQKSPEIDLLARTSLLTLAASFLRNLTCQKITAQMSNF